MFGRAPELDQVGQALRRPDLVGVLLCGAPGTGKSTLLDAAAARAEEQGFTVVRLNANRATSTIPLFVFSSLLAGGHDEATVERFAAVRQALRERSGGGPLVLAIDDAHELDDASAVLVSQLARETAAFMIASVRASEPTPEPIAALWSQGIAVRIDIAPLTRQAAAEVAGNVLQGLLDPALEAEIWRRTSGNPLHIRELILGSRAAGVVAEVGGVWSRTGELVTSDALIDLVGQRVGGLAPAEQATLCAIALAEPAGVALIEAVGDADALVALEEAGLVKVRRDRRRLVVGITHPMYGEAVRSTTSQLRVRQLRRNLATTVQGWGSRRVDDLIQVALWRLDANDTDPVLFANAAFEAVRRHDLDLAERLAVAAHEADPSPLSARALAMTRHLLGRHDEAMALLDAALRTGTLSEVDAAKVRLLAGLVLARGKGDYEPAVAALEQIGAGATERLRRRANAMLALIALLQGKAADGLAIARPLVDAGAVEAEAYTAYVGALAISGRPSEALRIADEYVARAGEPEPRTLFPDFRWVGLIDAGGVLQMQQEVEEDWDAAIETGDRHHQSRLAFAAGHVYVDLGRYPEAIAWFERSEALARSVGERFGVRWALCGKLLAAGQLGDLAVAEAASRGLAEVPGHYAELFENYGQRGAAWLASLQGRTRQAALDLVALAERFLADGRATHAVRSLADAARLGEARRAADVLDSLHIDLDGDLMPACTAFVDAMATKDADRLAAAAATFERLGYGGLAVAAAGATRDLLAQGGRQRDANSWAVQVKRLSLSAGAVPALMFSSVDAVVPLTRREREIAHLVANGHTSREVAESCFLSVRTVENHLARIYDKLGVRSRGELASALQPLLVGGAA